MLQLIRQLSGLLAAALLVSLGCILMVTAWFGWADRFGWPIGLLVLALSALGGFNVFMVFGVFFYVREILHWPVVECVAVSAACMIYATDRIAGGILQFLIWDVERRK